MSDYMTFEEAAEFLKTPHSTLYRWLREGRVPGHKLGRQWRFLRLELEAFRASGTRQHDDQVALAELSALLDERKQPEGDMRSSSVEALQLTDRLIWDAVDHGASVIHLQPSDGAYSLRYRTAEGMENLIELSQTAFDAIDRQLADSGTPTRNNHRRRLHLERQVNQHPERLQVRYQKLDTFAGERVALSLIQESRFPKSIDDITASPEDSETLRRWSQALHGLVLVSGRAGSGKTTTSFCCLEELARDSNRVIFTIEDSVEFLLSNVEQVEVDLHDDRAFRDTFEAVFASDPDVLFVSSSIGTRHQSTLWRHALSAAESGHLVFVQIDAVSTEHAQELFEQAVERSVEEQLVGVVWQTLTRDPETKRRTAHYDFKTGALGG